MSKDAGQSYPQMAEVCIFGGSAEGGKPFAECQEGSALLAGYRAATPAQVSRG